MMAGAASLQIALGSLKKSLHMLVLNEIDQFEVLSLANKLCVNIEGQDFFQQKLLVKIALLDQLLKSEPDNLNFRNLLEEARMRLNRVKSSNYLCCLVGCIFQTDKHRLYLQHLKKIHSTNQELICNYKHQCGRQFASYGELVKHVKELHSRMESSPKPSTNIEDEECKCILAVCRGRKFQSKKDLMSHVINFHKEDHRECIFENCYQKFLAGKERPARYHFKVKHKDLNELKLKVEHKTTVSREVMVEEFEQVFPSDNSDGVLEDSDSHELYTCDDFELLENDGEEINDDDESFFMMQYADFLNRMSHVKFIPHRTVQEISMEYLDKSLKSQEFRERQLRKSLKKVPDMHEDMIENIIDEALRDDQFIKAQKELSSQYRRNKYIKENFNYVPPVEIVLNKNDVRNGKPKDVVHYISVTESFGNLVQDRTFCELLDRKMNEVRLPGVSKDFTDGTYFRKNVFFQQNPGAFCAHFYSDSVELSNPLGAAKGKHKINQVFYSIAQVPREQRSKIDNIQLCMVFKDHLVKKYGYKVIFKTLVEDLKQLELGIVVEKPYRRTVQLGVLAYSADNLEAHSLGGFSCCFSSKDICRFCHAQYENLADHIHDYDADEPHDYWSITQYDAICDLLEENDDNAETHCDPELVDADLFFEEEQNEFDEDYRVVDNKDSEDETDDEDLEEHNIDKFGLRARCPLNELSAFHAVTSFPADCMHDLLEGVIAQVSLFLTY